jgi:cell division protein ZapA (FtsZ GTPase activity inhibitor)
MSNKVTIKVNINNTIYPVTCEIGEEDKLTKASNEVNKAIDELSSISGGISETRLLAMTSLVLADKLNEKVDVISNESINSNDQHLPHIHELLDWLTKSTERMNKVAKLLESK